MAHRVDLPPGLRQSLADRAVASLEAAFGQADGVSIAFGRADGPVFNEPSYGDLAILLGQDWPTGDQLLAAAEAFAWTASDLARQRLDAWLSVVCSSRPTIVLWAAGIGREPSTLALWARMVAQRFRYWGKPIVVVDEGAAITVREQLAGGEVCTAMPADVAVAVLFLADSLVVPRELVEMAEAGRLWAADFVGQRLMKVQPTATGFRAEPDPTFARHLETHRFSRSAAKTGGGRIPFPFGDIRVFDNLLGPTDAFGHRIGGPLEDLASRTSFHLVIAVFGGSGAFGPRCFHDETFAARLERRLNALQLRRDSQPLRFTVLNFGRSGVAVLQEMIHFLLFCHRIRPEIVISHSGMNDLGLALSTDPYLLTAHDITYWEPEGAEERPLELSERDLDDMVSTYLRRLQQFHEIVQASGATFIHGLQPLSCVKQPSRQEKLGLIEFLRYWPDYRKAVSYHPRLVSALRRDLAQWAAGREEAYIDFNLPFSARGADATLFYDHCHLTAEGHALVADIYAKRLVRLIPAIPGRAPPPSRPRGVVLPDCGAVAEMSITTLAEAAEANGFAELASRLATMGTESGCTGPVGKSPFTYPLE